MKKAVDLVEIGGGNVGSVMRCLERMDVAYRCVNADHPPDGSRPLILPGVGAFGAVMQHLRQNGLADEVRKLVLAGTPFLGICVGMQILFEGSAESVGVAGLSLVGGQVVRFEHGKVPQIGWNLIECAHSSEWESGYVYFVNSYYPKPSDDRAVLHRANYFGEFCASIAVDNITAFQFHPEKSGRFGENLLKRWLKSV